MKTGFPKEYIKPSDSVLCLFAAAFGGENDVRHIADIGCREVMMVDTDRAELEDMELVYDYSIHCGDVFDFIQTMGDYDVIVCDQWSVQDEQVHRIAGYLKSHCRVLILGCTERWLQGSRPEGEYYKRSEFNGGTYWRVL